MDEGAAEVMQKLGELASKWKRGPNGQLLTEREDDGEMKPRPRKRELRGEEDTPWMDGQFTIGWGGMR